MTDDDDDENDDDKQSRNANNKQERRKIPSSSTGHPRRSRRPKPKLETTDVKARTFFGGETTTCAREEANILDDVCVLCL